VTWLEISVSNISAAGEKRLRPASDFEEPAGDLISITHSINIKKKLCAQTPQRVKTGASL
jgi:hypothetical protein